LIGGFISQPGSGGGFRAGWDRMSIYLPVILMALIALGTYWLARNTPSAGLVQSEAKPTHEPDSFMRRFSVKSFDANGRLKSELNGQEGRHYPDTDTFEVDQPRMRAIGQGGDITLGTAKLAVSNADGSELQLIGDAVVTRQSPAEANGHVPPAMEIRGEYLHIYMNTERVTSNKPVEMLRDGERLSGDSFSFDNVTQVLEMNGRVKALLPARTAAPR
jgi:lipopolysaccharide export system protein LptC